MLKFLVSLDMRRCGYALGFRFPGREPDHHAGEAAVGRLALAVGNNHRVAHALASGML
jgi:hypothetical protein